MIVRHIRRATTIPCSLQRVSTYISTESHHDWCLFSSSFDISRTNRLHRYRFLTSARPLHDEDLHEEYDWDARKSNITPKRDVQAHILSPKINGPVEMGTQESDVSNVLRHVDTAANATYPSQVLLTTPMEDVNSETKNSISPSYLRYTDDTDIPITSVLHIVKPQDDVPSGIWPVFRLMDEDGTFRNPSQDVVRNSVSIDVNGRYNSVQENSRNDDDILTNLRSTLINMYPFQAQEMYNSGLLVANQFPFMDTNSKNTLLRAHQQLVRLRTMDTILQNAQRQGRISFYMTCTGEEAIHMGAASALTNQDPIFAQYREQGLLMWRGFTLEQFTNQCFSNDRDLGKGRQMPIHYGNRALNYHTVSSPLGTQLPQAVGAAYRLKLTKKPNVAICFFGDGCASTTDFHAALNFAATLSAPVIFFCRNNGYAISTPTKDQYAGDGIVSRAPGYGMAAIRVDGNDIFAVHAAVREAKSYALQHNAPVLIEGMTYRLGHHSTSDDSTRYRSENEVEEFADRMDPLVRFNAFLMRHGLLTDEGLAEMKDNERKAVLDAIKLAEKRPPPSLETMFEDVYKEMPKHLQKQMAQLKEHIAKYPEK